MRLRVTFSKEGWLIYSSHLDLMRVWERALRRAGMPLRYSAGYNPRPKLQLARALPLAHVGEEELIAFCKRRLEEWQVPWKVEFRRELPKSFVGKVLRRLLIEEDKIE